jgi:hypothetical protein
LIFELYRPKRWLNPDRQFPRRTIFK